MDMLTIGLLVCFAMLVMAIAQACYLVSVEVIEAIELRRRRKRRWKEWMNSKRHY